MVHLFRTHAPSTEDFVWVAHLDNGSTFPEIDANGGEHGWREVPTDRVSAIELIAQRPTHHDVRIEITHDAMPVFFRRRYVRLANGSGQVSRDGVTVVGWESSSERWYLVIDADGNNRTVRDLGAIP